MKILKYAAIILVLLVLAFIAKGFLTPSVTYENEISVNQPAEEAWEVMSDEAKTSDWIIGFKKTELVSGTPNTVGAVSNIYFEENGEEMMMKETITTFRPNEHMGMNFSMDFMDMDYDLFLNEKDGRTHIRTKTKASGNGIFAKSILSFMTGSMQAQEDENLKNLKKVIEENSSK